MFTTQQTYITVSINGDTTFNDQLREWKNDDSASTCFSLDKAIHANADVCSSFSHIFSWNDDGLELARPAMVDHKISLASLIVPQHVHTFPYQWIGLLGEILTGNHGFLPWNDKPWLASHVGMGQTQKPGSTEFAISLVLTNV